MPKLLKIQETLYILFQIIVGFLTFFSFVMIFSTKEKELQHRFAFICGQSIGFITCSIVPMFFKEILKVKFPPIILLVYLLYLILHFILGEIVSLYVLVKHYDSFLHLSSAVMLSFLAYSILISLQEGQKFNSWLTFFVCVCFAMTCGYLWELAEYLIDDLFESNMQRFMVDATGEVLIGHRALTDTMKDMFLNSLGAIFASYYLKVYGVKHSEFFKIEYLK